MYSLRSLGSRANGSGLEWEEGSKSWQAWKPSTYRLGEHGEGGDDEQHCELADREHGGWAGGLVLALPVTREKRWVVGNVFGGKTVGDRAGEVLQSFCWRPPLAWPTFPPLSPHTADRGGSKETQGRGRWREGGEGGGGCSFVQ